ncbi:MAG: xanthine dehydrogenase family protein molybdopterin-binding subunit [Methylocystaceae bacterium]|nr:xanthine dehydrogenase family protein molybdopterin-binding subunit [Methylocystaceae bacterium]
MQAPITFPNGCHAAEIELDPHTGAVEILNYIAIDDYGRLINPMLTESQVQGGIAQGIGQALMEGIQYDPDTGQLITSTFMDYAMPRAKDMPFMKISLVECPTTSNPLGVKGAGQAGAIGAPQTIINAILDALRPYGITHIDMPATPARILAAIENAAKQKTL